MVRGAYVTFLTVTDRNQKKIKINDHYLVLYILEWRVERNTKLVLKIHLIDFRTSIRTPHHC